MNRLNSNLKALSITTLFIFCVNIVSPTLGFAECKVPDGVEYRINKSGIRLSSDPSISSIISSDSSLSDTLSEQESLRCEKIDTRKTLVRNFSKVLRFNGRAPSLNPVYCDPTSKPCDSAYEIFIANSKEFLTNSSYKNIESDSLDRQLEESLHEIREKEEARENLRNELRTPSKFDPLKKISTKLIKEAIVEGPFGLVAKGGISAVAAGVKKTKAFIKPKLSPSSAQSSSKPIKIEDLFPGQDGKHAVVNGTSGALMVLLGTAGLALDIGSAGVAGFVTSVPGAAVKVGSQIVKAKLASNTGKRWARALSSASHHTAPGTNGPKPKSHAKGIVSSSVEAPSGEVAEHSAEHVAEHGAEHAAEHATEHAALETAAQFTRTAGNAIEGGTSEVVHAATTGTNVTVATYAAHILPFVANTTLITSGIKNISQAIFGYEKGHVVLKEYEKVFENVLRSSLISKKIQINNALNQADELLINYDNASDVSGENTKKENIQKQINCLCIAQDWISKMETTLNERFAKRYDYLETVNLRKDKLASSWNTAKSIVNRDDSSKDLSNLQDLIPNLEKNNMDLKIRFKNLSDNYKEWLSNSRDPDGAMSDEFEQILQATSKSHDEIMDEIQAKEKNIKDSSNMSKNDKRLALSQIIDSRIKIKELYETSIGQLLDKFDEGLGLPTQSARDLPKLTLGRSNQRDKIHYTKAFRKDLSKNQETINTYFNKREDSINEQKPPLVNLEF